MNKKNIIKLITFTTLSMAAVNKIISLISNANNVFNKNDYLTFKSIFGNVKYRKYGNGDPILLLHNLSIGDNINEWNYIIDNLSEHYTVYAINLPGCGNSDKNNMLYTNFMYVKLINDFVKKVIGKKTDIVTSGTSNRIAVMAELYNSDIINNIFAINPSEPSIPKYSNLICKVINLPIIGTFLYNCLFTKKYCFKNTENNFRLYEYMNTYYDSIHYNNSKSKYLYTSIIGGKTYINYEHIIKNINKEIFTYMDNTHIYPHIETPEKIIEFILNTN